ncbi:hypothetical protein PoB_007049900 [Plakobranchus ocellatus]|uniref:Uncharacterized protein n=1 Tax=Plakobranchus ocellatus TaxID=259542 RepID=A0AAV4DJ03_9GAST|nr:hypothetical protein PoB_007049900 [Plakobranchus ocellatus]
MLCDAEPYTASDTDKDSAPLIQDKEGEGGEDNGAMPFWKKKKKAVPKSDQADAGGKQTYEAIQEKPVANGDAELAEKTDTAVKEEKEEEEEAVDQSPTVPQETEQQEEPKTKEDDPAEIADNGENQVPESQEGDGNVELPVNAETSGVTFAKEVSVERQDSGEVITTAPTGKSEKSPLISKEEGQEGEAVPGAADLNVGKGDKTGGFLCCSIF